jgi:curved DNA-binding protein
VQVQVPGIGAGAPPEPLTIRVPPGTINGSRLRLLARGHPGIGSGPPGDLVLQVRLTHEPTVRVDGRDLHLTLPITPWEATLGATMTLDTPAGARTVTVPPGTQPGTVLSRPGEGITNPDGPAGDLHLEVAVIIPTHLTSDEHALWLRLARQSRVGPRTPHQR